MHVEEKIAMRTLAEARAAIHANHRQKTELTNLERERRVREYARQVEACGCIFAWLPPAEPRPRYCSRFRNGDILRPHRT